MSKPKPVNDALVDTAEQWYQAEKAGKTKKWSAVGTCDICAKKRKIALCADGLYRCLKCLNLAFPDGFVSIE